MISSLIFALNVRKYWTCFGTGPLSTEVKTILIKIAWVWERGNGSVNE